MRKILLTVAVGVFCVSTASESFAYTARVYDPSLGKQNLFLLGFGELTFNSFSIKGSRSAFEQGNTLYSNEIGGTTYANYRASMFANGNVTPKLFLNGSAVVDSRIDDEYRTADPSLFRLRMSLNSTEPIWDGWRFTAYGTYDPNRQWELGNLDSRLLTQPQKPLQTELYARLQSEKNGYVEAGSLHPSFRQSQFTLKNRAVFGAFADLNTELVGVEAVAGKLEGKRFREGSAIGIPADGTAGQYMLSIVPVVRGSESVKIETRDRFSTSTVLETKILKRDVDYSIDYERGRIILNEPVPSSTLSDDPNFIVITYGFEREQNDDILGARGRVMPTETSQFGATLLHRNVDDGAASPILDPDNIFAADGSFRTVNGRLSGSGEIAGSEIEATDNTPSAVRADLTGKPTDELTLRGNFSRLEDDFRAFNNGDLNPIKNQQRLDLDGDYTLGARQNLNAGFSNYRGLEENGANNSYPGLRNENVYRAGYRNRFNTGFNLGARLEERKVFDRSDNDTEDNEQFRAILDLDGSRERLGFLGRFGYQFHYEFINFSDLLNDETDEKYDSRTNQAGLSLASTPWKSTTVSLVHKLLLRENREQTAFDTYDNREDETFGSILFRPNSLFSSVLTAQYKQWTVPGSKVGLWEGNPYRIERVGTLAAEYYPERYVKLWAKFGHYQLEQLAIDNKGEYTKDYIQGQATWFATHHLSVTAETELFIVQNRPMTANDGRTWDLGGRLNWNRDRFTEFTVGGIRRLEKLNGQEGVTYIVLASAAVRIWRGWFASGSIKELLLDTPINDEKNFERLELGYENPKWFRVSVGYERIESDPEPRPEDYYRAHGPFIKLVGKI